MISDRELIKQALLDAIGWQDGLIDAYSNCKDDPAYADHVQQKKAYQRLLKKRYGNVVTPLDRMLKDCKTVDVWKLISAKPRKFQP